MAVYQSTLETIRNNVIAKLRLDEADDSDRVDEWINQSYLEACQQTACLQQTGSASLTTGTNSYSLPSEVAQIKLLQINYGDGSISYPMQRVRLEKILQTRHNNTAVGQRVDFPVYAVVGQNQLEIWPEPTTGQYLTFWYSYLPDELEDDDDEPLIQEPYGSQLLELGACVKAAIFKKDPLLSDYESQYAVWMARFQAWLNRRQGGSQAFEVWSDDFYPADMQLPYERDR